jgi:hypothetical protein
MTQGQQLARLLVLGGPAVIGDVTGDQHGVEVVRQGVQEPGDPARPVGGARPAVEVEVAEVRDHDHCEVLSRWPLSILPRRRATRRAPLVHQERHP